MFICKCKCLYVNQIQLLLQGPSEDVDIVTFIIVRRLNWVDHINPIDDTRKVKQIFNSETEGVRTRGRPRTRWWEYGWRDIKKGRITNYR